jgi:hypothetical protein
LPPEENSGGFFYAPKCRFYNLFQLSVQPIVIEYFSSKVTKLLQTTTTPKTLYLLTQSTLSRQTLELSEVLFSPVIGKRIMS